MSRTESGTRGVAIAVSIACIAFLSPGALFAEARAADEISTDPVQIRLQIDKWRQFTEGNRDDWGKLTYGALTQAQLYARLGEFEKAAETIRDSAQLYEKEQVFGTPTPIARDRWVSGSQYIVHKQAGQYKEAAALVPAVEKAEKRYISAVRVPDDQRALMLVQIHPGWDADLYEKLGQEASAREKYEQARQFLLSEETEKNILSKLKEPQRTAWEFNRDFRFPLKVAQLYIREKKVEEAEKILLGLRQKLGDPEFVKHNTRGRVMEDIFKTTKKHAEEAMRACGMSE